MLKDLILGFFAFVPIKCNVYSTKPTVTKCTFKSDLLEEFNIFTIVNIELNERPTFAVICMTLVIPFVLYKTLPLLVKATIHIKFNGDFTLKRLIWLKA